MPDGISDHRDEEKPTRFCELLDQCILERIERPRTHPGKRQLKQIAFDCGCTTETIRQYRRGDRLPSDIDALLNAVLGPNTDDDNLEDAKWRRELKAAYDRGRTRGPAEDRATRSEPVSSSAEAQEGQGIHAVHPDDENPRVYDVAIALPYHFVGRDDDIAAIDTALATRHEQPNIAVLYGQRGVGKTVLAAKYAELRRGRYRVIWGIGAQTTSGIRARLIGLGRRIGWIDDDGLDEADALYFVLQYLSNEGGGILLIYDNAIDVASVQPYLPFRGSAHIIITSNSAAWEAFAVPRRIVEWPPEVGAEFLSKAASRDDESAAAQALSKALGGLPLAHSQAASYCLGCSVGFAEYLDRFNAEPIRFLDDPDHADPRYEQVNRRVQSDRLTVARTFMLAITEATRRHASAKHFLFHATMLPKEPIPLFLFVAGQRYFTGSLGSALRNDELNSIVEALLTFALLERAQIRDETDSEVVVECVRVHRLVAEIAMAAHSDNPTFIRKASALALLILGRREPSIRTDPVSRMPALAYSNRSAPFRFLSKFSDNLEMTVDPVSQSVGVWMWIMASQFSGGKADDFVQRPYLRYTLPIVIRFIEMIKTYPRTSRLLLGELLQYIGIYIRTALGDYRAGLSYLEQGSEHIKQHLGANHFWVTRSLSFLANIKIDQGQYESAEVLFMDILRIRKKTFSSPHPWIAHSLDNISGVYRRQHKFDEALHYCELAFNMRKEFFGLRDSLTASSLHFLGAIHLDKGDTSAALPLLLQALEIKQSVLPEDHIEIVETRDRLGLLYAKEGQIADAIREFTEILKIRDKHLPRYHPKTIDVINILARLSVDNLDLDAARNYTQVAIERLPDFPTIAQNDAANNALSIGEILAKRGFLSQAASLFSDAINLREQLVGLSPVVDRCKQCLTEFREAVALDDDCRVSIDVTDMVNELVGAVSQLGEDARVALEDLVLRK